MSIWTHLERAFGREIAKAPIPEAPAIAPDFGNPDQHFDVPGPIDFELSPSERHAATMAKIELEDKRRAANKRDEDTDLAKLGVEFLEPRS